MGRRRLVRMWHPQNPKDLSGGVLSGDGDVAMRTSICALSAVVAIAMVLLCFVVSSVASVPANEYPQRQFPPFVVEGFVYEADGVTPAVDCVVNVTNKNTGEWILTGTDPWGYGWYEAQFEFHNVTEGDLFNVTAMKDWQIGWNESVYTGGPILDLNITMSGTIPEFPSLIAPVLGLTCLVVLVLVARRTRN